nr:alpha/beta fold hydrolase [Actibacterium sp. 188UL27-1]
MGKWLGRLLLLLIVAGGAVWVLGPREPVDRDISFDPDSLTPNLDRYLAEAEAEVANLNPDVLRRIVWAGSAGQSTPLSIVYLHGFSATSEEIRPVPDRLAEALGANLHFVRYKGHGRNGAAMAEATAGDWLEETAEALEIGRRIGDQVIVIATSTGGTLAAIAATDPAMSAEVAGLILVSPNFELVNPLARLLTWPFARSWLPLLAGSERSFAPLNDDHARYWTTRYPSEAVFPMAALVRHARRLDYGGVTIPALFIFSDGDMVVKAKTTRTVIDRWGAPTQMETPKLTDADDPGAHVIMGDILSPGQTAPAVALMRDWVAGL